MFQASQSARPTRRAVPKSTRVGVPASPCHRSVRALEVPRTKPSDSRAFVHGASPPSRDWQLSKSAVLEAPPMKSKVRVFRAMLTFQLPKLEEKAGRIGTCSTFVGPLGFGLRVSPYISHGVLHGSQLLYPQPTRLRLHHPVAKHRARPVAYVCSPRSAHTGTKDFQGAAASQPEGRAARNSCANGFDGSTLEISRNNSEVE